MTDKELLELAAKAAGYQIHASLQAERDDEGCGYMGLWVKGISSCWNPLTDDGDALRLAVKLHIDLDLETYGCCAGNRCIENISTTVTLEEATRRAIVRAAAEIGKAMS